MEAAKSWIEAALKSVRGCSGFGRRFFSSTSTIRGRLGEWPKNVARSSLPSKEGLLALPGIGNQMLRKLIVGFDGGRVRIDRKERTTFEHCIIKARTPVDGGKDVHGGL